MKALSVKQPWSGLIIAGIKTVENRSWSTMYSGPLAIAATKQPDKRAMLDMARELGKLPDVCNINGAILGVCNLTALIWTGQDGIPETDMTHLTTAQQRKILQWWDHESVGWILANPRALAHPLQHKGALGLRDLPADVVAKLVYKKP